MASLIRTSSHGSQTPIINDHRASTNTFGYREGETPDQYEIRSLDKIREDLLKLQKGSAGEFDIVKNDIEAVKNDLNSKLEAVKNDMNSKFDEVNATLTSHDGRLDHLQSSVDGLRVQGDKHEKSIKVLRKMLRTQQKMLERQQRSLDKHSKILKHMAKHAGVDISDDDTSENDTSENDTSENDTSGDDTSGDDNSEGDIRKDHLPASQATGSAVALPEVVVTHTPTSSMSSTELQFRAVTPPSPPSRAGPSTLPVPSSQFGPSSRLSKKHSFLSLPHVARLRAQSEPDVREALEAREVHETFRLLEADHRPEVKKGLRDVVRLFRKAFSNKSG